LREGDISQQSVHKFYDAVRAYYTKALSYSVEWLPLENKIKNNCDFVNFDLCPFCSFHQVEAIIECFPIHFKKFENRKKLDGLEEEFCQHQQLSKDEIPRTV